MGLELQWDRRVSEAICELWKVCSALINNPNPALELTVLRQYSGSRVLGLYLGSHVIGLYFGSQVLELYLGFEVLRLCLGFEVLRVCVCVCVFRSCFRISREV